MPQHEPREHLPVNLEVRVARQEQLRQVEADRKGAQLARIAVAMVALMAVRAEATFSR